MQGVALVVWYSDGLSFQYFNTICNATGRIYLGNVKRKSQSSCCATPVE